MAAVFVTIAERLIKLSPGIDIGDYISGTPTAHDTTLDGIEFEPRNLDGSPGYRDLQQALTDVKDSYGERAFAGDTPEDRSHWVLKLSLMATEGVGLREVWRLPPLPTQALGVGGDSHQYGGESTRFSAQFGRLSTVPKMSALHVGMTNYKCKIHIDEAAFVVEHQGSISLTPDLVQHTADELGLKTFVKGMAPGWLKPLFDHISLIYPHLGNAYSRTGPTFGQLLSWSSHAPVVGRYLGSARPPGPLGMIPLPGIEVDLLRRDAVTVRAVASCSLFDTANCSVTIGASGVF